jgi:2'-5' RNA ligase
MRLFFALWPDAPARDALEALARELGVLSGGKPVPAAKIHLTLAFLGEVGEARVEEASKAASSGRWRRVEVTLDTVGSFRGARVAWAGCRRPGAGLLDLQSGLARALAERGFGLDERPYTPHVTLARKIVRAVPPGTTPEVTWTARELALVKSETGKGSYATLAQWDLG